jgi:hypothetical protein
MRGLFGQLERDPAIAALAKVQHGVVSAAQLRKAGLTARAIDHRVSHERLHVVHRGVYAVGHPLLTMHGRWMAAVLAAGAGAVLSHRSAGGLWKLRHWAGEIEVTSPRRAASRTGIRVYRVRDLHPDEVAVVDGIPVTSLARTLLDVAGVVGRQSLERTCDQAEILGLFNLAELHTVLERHPKRRGGRALGRVLREHAIGTTPTHRELKARFLRFCVRNGLPKPQCNVALAIGVEKTTVDFLWRNERVVVETDGWETHRTRRAFEHDRARDQRLAAAGYRSLRVTWRQLSDEPDRVEAALRALLGP